MSSSPSIAQDAPAPLHLLRVTRLEDRVVEECELGPADLQQLADQNVGLFAGGYRTIEMMERQLIQLAKSQAACRWVVAVSSKQLLADTTERLRVQVDETVCWESFDLSNDRVGHLRLSTVEGLRKYAAEELDGVILYDPRCHVHKARHFSRFNGQNHDRPQLVANFMASQRAKGASPLLWLMTLKGPRSVGTASVARAYMLDAWWFADPLSLRFVDRCSPWSM